MTKRLLYTLFAFILPYVAVSFSAIDANPFHWSYAERLLTFVLGSTLAFCVFNHNK